MPVAKKSKTAESTPVRVMNKKELTRRIQVLNNVILVIEQMIAAMSLKKAKGEVGPLTISIPPYYLSSAITPKVLKEEQEALREVVNNLNKVLGVM